MTSLMEVPMTTKIRIATLILENLGDKPAKNRSQTTRCRVLSLSVRVVLCMTSVVLFSQGSGVFGAELRPYAVPQRQLPAYQPHAQQPAPVPVPESRSAPGAVVDPSVYENFKQYARKQSAAKRRELIGTYSVKQKRALAANKAEEVKHYQQLLEILKAIR